MDGHTVPGRPLAWDELSSREIGDLRARGLDMVILPVGSTEQHGPHLPTNVDILCAYEIARSVSALTGVPVLPPLPYGNSEGHDGWPGTLALRPETFQRVVEEICGWVKRSGFRRILVLNGHLSNAQPLWCAMMNVRFDHPDLYVRAMNWWDVTPEIHAIVHSDLPHYAFHANDAETSVMLHLREPLVRLDLAPDETAMDLKRLTFFTYRLRQISETGVTGNPLIATREKGQKLFNMAVEALAVQVRQALREEPPLAAQ